MYIVFNYTDISNKCFRRKPTVFVFFTEQF